MGKELPKNWIETTLGESFHIERGGSPRPIENYITENEDGINWIKIGDTKNVNKYIYSTKEKIKPEGLKKSRMVYEDDFILSNSMSFGRPFIMKTKGCIHDGWLVIRKNENIDNNFLYYLLSSNLVYKQFSELAKGSTVKNLNIQAVQKVKIPLPLLKDQLIIAEKLDTLFAHLETIKQRMEKVPELLKQFRQAVLTQAVTGKLTEEFHYSNVLKLIEKDKLLNWSQQLKLKQIKRIPDVKNNLSPASIEKLKVALSKEYDIASFDQLSEAKPHALKAGPFGSALKKDYYVEKGYKIYGQEQVIKNDQFFGDYYINEARFQLLKSCAVASGDILISLVGTIGKVLVISEDFEPGIINPRLVKLSLHKNINPHFIKMYLQSDFVVNHLKENSHGGTMDVLNLGILKALPIPVPSIEEQTEIVRRVETLFAKADAIEVRYKQLKTQVDELPQALLAKAFRGEI